MMSEHILSNQIMSDHIIQCHITSHQEKYSMSRKPCPKTYTMFEEHRPCPKSIYCFRSAYLISEERLACLKSIHVGSIDMIKGPDLGNSRLCLLPKIEACYMITLHSISFTKISNIPRTKSFTLLVKIQNIFQTK